MDFLNLSHQFISLLTLTFLEIVLGIDNLIFISLITQRLPVSEQKAARRLGLTLAWVTRLILLASVVWIAGLVFPLFYFFTWPVSGRDLLLLSGGLFLIYKAVQEIYRELACSSEAATLKKTHKFFLTVVQIGILDIVFSLDSVITAIGLTEEFWIMATAITIAILLMVAASEPLSRLVHRYPTIRMLALGLLILIGMILVADSFKQHIPRGYIYFTVFFSISIEVLNLIRRKRQT
jgi:predicted tellurium resistance membrane protein TerC